MNRSADDEMLHGGSKLQDRRQNKAEMDARRRQQLAGVGGWEGRGHLHRDGSAKDDKRVRKLGELGRGLSSDDAGGGVAEKEGGGCCVVS